MKTEEGIRITNTPLSTPRFPEIAVFMEDTALVAATLVGKQPENVKRAKAVIHAMFGIHEWDEGLDPSLRYVEIRGYKEMLRGAARQARIHAIKSPQPPVSAS